MIKGMLRKVYWHREEEHIAELAALCPACGFEHQFRVDLDGHGKWKEDQGIWNFNGNYDCPTFSPSMLSNENMTYEHHPICHSFLENGNWRFLSDSTHKMAGQIVPMIAPDPNMNWKQRHGWHLFPWTDDEGEPRKENK